MVMKKIIALIVCSMGLFGIQTNSQALYGAEKKPTKILKSKKSSHHKSSKHKKSHDPDYLIVGGGTAGSVLARRLSEHHKVVLLESGTNEDENSLIEDPLNAPTLANKYTNRFFAMYGHSREDEFPDNRRLPAIAGQLLGGGSSVNQMLYIRGTTSFFNEWESIAGDSDWGAANALNVYKRLENFNGVPTFFIPAQHGFNGPVDIRQASANVPASITFQSSVITAFNMLHGPGLTIGVNEDYNDFSEENGASVYSQLFQMPNKNRESASTAYLQDILKKKSDNVYVSRNKNLTVITSARVLNVLFSHKKGCKPRAIGVNAVVDGCPKKFKSKKKVIISTGFYSPTLLEYSGIGDSCRLEQLGIPVVYHNPNVGEHVLNHPIITLTGIGNVQQPDANDPQALLSGVAELPDPTDNITPNNRDLQILGVAAPNAEDPNSGAFVLIGFLFSAESAGRIHAIYSDPLRVPEFDFNYFTQQSDRDTAVSFYKIMYKTLTTMGLTPTGLDPAMTSDQDLEAFILTRYSQANHWTGSCKMGQSSANSVVDSTGHVFGVDDLVVADIQIIPLSPNANTAGPAFLVGNVIADKLLAA